MKKLLVTFTLLFAATSANAAVISLFNKKPTSVASVVNLSTLLKPVSVPAPVQPANVPTPPAPQQKIATVIPEQHFVIFTEETKRQINDIVNCVDEPKNGGHDNVSAVPVPAALPLMATAFGIFGITRRRKAFK